MRFQPLKTSQYQKWTLFHLEGRLDSFCDRYILEKIQTMLPLTSAFVALELSRVEFMSLNLIRGLQYLGDELRQKGGDLVLLSPSLVVQKHLDAYNLRNPLRIALKGEQLEQESTPPRVRAEYKLVDV